MRSYERLGIEEFGRQLLESRDLDPTYVALTAALGGGRVSPEQVHRWLVAFWTWYHAGIACWLSEKEGPDFWAAMAEAARNETFSPIGGRWPRGKERRHNRGAQARQCVALLSERYPHPEDMLEVVSLSWAGGHCKEVMRAATGHYLFGPWIGFKVADMIERILRVPVEFTDAEVFMFEDPRKGAAMFWQRWKGTPGPAPLNASELREVVEYLCDTFKGYRAPPHGDRPVSLQEVETVLCKWKSHINGAYPLWNDTDEIREGLSHWKQHSKFAEIFLEGMPSRPEEAVA